MTTSVQRRRGSTVQHSSFTGLEGEITVDTNKDTAVVHDGSTIGGFPLAKENLANTNTTNLTAIIGTDTAADDTFLIYDASASAMKKITRAELNNAIEKEPLSNVTINSGSIDGTTIGSTTRSTGKFTSLDYNTTLTGGTGVVNLGSGQFYKDASGNIGIGTTPSAWVSGADAIDIKSYTSFSQTANGFAGMTHNVYESAAGVFTYKQTAAASLYLQAAGTHQWYSAASGTAGTTATITERMRIDSSGNLGIGTSSPAAKLEVSQATTDATVLQEVVRVSTTGRSASVGVANRGTLLTFLDASNPTLVGAVGGIRETPTGNYNGGLAFYTNATGTSPSTSVSTLTEQMRITSAGNVGIGTTTPLTKLSVADVNVTGNDANISAVTTNTQATGVGATLGLGGLYDATGSTFFGTIRGGKENSTSGNYAGFLSFGTVANGGSTTEKMRIDAIGNVGIGITPTEKLQVAGVTNVRIKLTETSGNASAVMLQQSINSYLLADNAWLFYTNSTERMRIDSSGNVGIGTASPAAAYKLSLTGNGTTVVGGLQLSSNGNIAYIGQVGATEANCEYWNAANGYVRIGTNNTERMRIASTGELLVGKTTVTANGANLQTSDGITFPATAVASSDANTLDDYEEGTFTPVITGTTTAGTGTYSTQVGNYTKIGRLVYVKAALVWSAHTGTGSMTITGLPFTSGAAGLGRSVGSLNVDSLTYTGTFLIASMADNSTVISLTQSTSGAGSTGIPMDTSAIVYVSISYQV